MRYAIAVAWLVASAAIGFAQEQVAPQEAYRYVDKNTEIQVEFPVQRTGVTKTKSLFFLNSAKDLKLKENLTVIIPIEVVDQLHKKGLVGSPDEYFRGRTVKATGFVVSFKDKAGPQLRLKDAGQLEWVPDAQVGGGSLFTSIYTYIVLGGILVLGASAWLFSNKKAEK